VKDDTLAHPTVPFAPEADPRAFRDALGRFATGITVITTQTPDGPVGFTANSFAAVSLDPALVLWSPARASARFPIFATAAFYTIHVLRADQQDISARFHRGGDGFDGLTTTFAPEGMPILPDALARFDCTLHATHDGGDHLIVVGRVIRAAFGTGAPLVFSQGGYATLA
jgi:flavin reductase (DIM6/NTAB) family NADH-FMN oxidoreductase RutF